MLWSRAAAQPREGGTVTRPRVGTRKDPWHPVSPWTALPPGLVPR